MGEGNGRDDHLPVIKINTWMGEGLLLLVPLSENLARIAGSGGNRFTARWYGKLYRAFF